MFSPSWIISDVGKYAIIAISFKPSNNVRIETQQCKGSNSWYASLFAISSVLRHVNINDMLMSAVYGDK